MKKAYVKPAIMFESFTLCTNIAAGCEFKNGQLQYKACGYKTRNGIVFTDKLYGCESVIPDNLDTFCYHVPDASRNIFNS